MKIHAGQRFITRKGKEGQVVMANEQRVSFRVAGVIHDVTRHGFLKDTLKRFILGTLERPEKREDFREKVDL